MVCATIASCDDFDDIAARGEAHPGFLRRFPPFHHGVPGQEAVEEKSNEIAAIPLLLERRAAISHGADWNAGGRRFPGEYRFPKIA